MPLFLFIGVIYCKYVNPCIGLINSPTLFIFLCIFRFSALLIIILICINAIMYKHCYTLIGTLSFTILTILPLLIFSHTIKHFPLNI